MEIIAHRGFSARAPENTLAAVEAAVRAGAHAVEFDVHVAACGTPVLFHDATLDRTTDGTGVISRHTFEQLERLDAGAWFAPEFAGERIPTLAEALAACRGRVGRVYPEVKGFREPGDLDEILRVASEAGMLTEVVFIAMDWEALDHVRRLEPELAVGYIVDERREVDAALARASGDGSALVDFRASLLLEEPAVADRCVEEGVETAVWTVDDEAEAEALARLGVRRFTTNEVARLLTWAERRGAG